MIRQTVKKIVKLAGRSDLQMDRILAVRHKISDFACYEPAMEMFHEKCFSLNKVCSFHGSNVILLADFLL